MLKPCQKCGWESHKFKRYTEISSGRSMIQLKCDHCKRTVEGPTLKLVTRRWNTKPSFKKPEGIEILLLGVLLGAIAMGVINGI